MEKQTKLEVRVTTELRVTAEKVSLGTQISARKPKVEVYITSNTPAFKTRKSSISKLLRDILVVIQAWFLNQGAYAGLN
ncbi:uncharacterized protein BKA55DRAFT_586087 [Fusarium redolens]|uniref:Uncharacterized protein n=1 Tax=Fusarium redolens TaxID=48865 RepID=A0A9P9FYH1_FUSRE|nr:uncharacterized protein BKA55DRAFT_586087 [Fusarium redolens]KAH7208430.1 hypothetical protein BKA55DRAFT_586087 [Fusarium redolens]